MVRSGLYVTRHPYGLATLPCRINCHRRIAKKRSLSVSIALNSCALYTDGGSFLDGSVLARRFLMPPIVVTLAIYLRSKALVSPRAEVELSKLLHIGPKTKVSSFTKIKVVGGPLRIGRSCSIARGCFITSGQAGLSIGDYCLIGANCTIVSNTYRYDSLGVPFEMQGHESKGTSIGNNVLIGSNCVIVDGAVIEDNVMIGAQSFVSGKIPKNSVAQGNPAKVIFTRR
jgi:acetyltransferase-like isoleucine patch superfamily enzyme